jgi:single-strand DNA-binding protein
MRKGSPLLVEGRLRLDQWDDKQSGQKRSKLGVVGEIIQFLGSPRAAEGGAPAAPRTPAAAAAPSAPEPPEADAPPHEGDDVPF